MPSTPEKLDSEVKLYLSLPAISADADPLDWWKAESQSRYFKTPQDGTHDLRQEIMTPRRDHTVEKENEKRNDGGRGWQLAENRASRCTIKF